MSEENRPELFHLVSETGSRHVRQRMVELGLVGRLSMRNVAFDVHRDALRALGGESTPAIHEGGQLHVGETACLELLSRLASQVTDT